MCGTITDREYRVPQPHLLEPAHAPAAPAQPITVVLIHDNRSTRDGIVAIIRKQPGFKILATAAVVEEALRLVQQRRPQVVLLDLGGDVDDRLTLAGALHGEVPESRVVLMGVRLLQEDIESFIQAGVSGFIMADATVARLVSTLQSVADGIQVLPPELAAPLFVQLNRHGHKPRRKPSLDAKQLTAREREVADLIVQGFANKEIARRMGIALHTVKSHVHKVLSKLAVNTRLEVAAFAQREARRQLPEGG